MDEEIESPIAEALGSIAYQLKYLGNGNASTQMGALEALGAVFVEGFKDITAAIYDHAEAIRELAQATEPRVCDCGSEGG